VLKTRRLAYISLLLVAGLSPAAAQTGWKVLNTFHIGGEGGWDYVTVDEPTHRLFLTRTTHTIIIDDQTGKQLGDIPGQKHAHGLAIVPELGRGFITDGDEAAEIVVFDLKSYAVLGKIPAIPGLDGIIYDAKQRVVIAVSGDENAVLTFSPDIDPMHGKIDPPIKLGGAPEYLATDGRGKLYVNLADKDVVAVVDLKTRKVASRWPVAPGGHPVAMDLDIANHRLLVGCRNPQKLVVMNANTGAVEASLPIGANVDAVLFFEGQAFASARDGKFTIAGNKNGAWIVEQTVKTPEGARTMGVDEGTHRIYLPTAELQPGSNAIKPIPIPGTFVIVEIGH
jgi:hypothetical protein